MKRITPVIIFIGLVLGMLLFPYIPMSIFNFNIDNFSEKMKIIYNFVCDIGYVIIIIMIYKDQIFNEFKSYFRDFKKHFKLGIKYYLIGLLIMVVSNLLINYLFSGAIAANEETVRSLIKHYPVYMLFSVAIYAPVVEETIFRRSIKDCFIELDKNNFIKYIYTICSGFIFGLMHILGHTTKIIDYLYIIPYMALGSAFAALYHKTDNLWDSIIFHSLHNLVAIILFLGLGI